MPLAWHNIASKNRYFSPLVIRQSWKRYKILSDAHEKTHGIFLLSLSRFIFIQSASSFFSLSLHLQLIVWWAERRHDRVHLPPFAVSSEAEMKLKCWNVRGRHAEVSLLSTLFPPHSFTHFTSTSSWTALLSLLPADFCSPPNIF